MKSKNKALIAASVAGLMAIAGAGMTGTVHAAGEGEEPCYGVNACKGTGECGGKGHSCSGKNACKGQGYLTLSESDCLKIAGGRLTTEA